MPPTQPASALPPSLHPCTNTIPPVPSSLPLRKRALALFVYSGETRGCRRRSKHPLCLPPIHPCPNTITHAPFPLLMPIRPLPLLSLDSGETRGCRRRSQHPLCRLPIHPCTDTITHTRTLAPTLALTSPAPSSPLTQARLEDAADAASIRFAALQRERGARRSTRPPITTRQRAEESPSHESPMALRNQI
jgi:hypothetical protein